MAKLGYDAAKRILAKYDNDEVMFLWNTFCKETVADEFVVFHNDATFWDTFRKPSLAVLAYSKGDIRATDYFLTYGDDGLLYGFDDIISNFDNENFTQWLANKEKEEFYKLMEKCY